MAALHLLGLGRRHAVVAQVIESHLRVRAVNDVAHVLRAAKLGILAVLDAAHGQVEKAVDLAHPLAVARGEVIVDRHHVHAAPGERVEIGGEGRHQRLAFARRHFGDASGMEHHPADQLDVERNHLPGHFLPAHEALVLALGQAAARVLHRGKGLGQQRVERFPLGEALLEFGRLGDEMLVRQALVFKLDPVDFFHERPQALDFALIFRAENFFNKPLDHKRKRGKRTSLPATNRKREAKFIGAEARLGKEGWGGVVTSAISPFL